MKDMSLRIRIVFIVTSICLGLFGSFYFYSSYKISEGFSKIEKDDAETSVLTLQDGIAAQRNIMLSKASDWSQWDDAYKYLNDRNETFEKANLQPALALLKFDLFSYWGLDGKVIWGRNIDLKTNDVSKTLLAISKEDEMIIQNVQHLHQFKDYLDKKFSFVKLTTGPYLFVSIPVTSSDGKSPVNAQLIAGVRLDSDFFSRMSKQLHLKVESFLTGSVLINEVNNQEKLKKLESHTSSIEYINDKVLNIYGKIKDYQDKNLILYKIIVTRDIHIQSLKTLKMILVAMILSAIVLVFLMLLSINKLVVSKILTLSRIIVKVKDTGDLTLKIPDLGKDEIGLLSSSFNEMLFEIEKLRAASFHNEKMASLGEMAGGIAHEINNPITIISASSNLMRKMFSKGIMEPEKYLKQIDDIDKTVIRISKIIQGLKNVSRDTTNEAFSECSLLDVITDSLAVCNEKFKINAVEIRFNPNDPALAIPFNCLRVQLSQVIFNLLGNSFDAIDKSQNPWVEIAVTSSNNFLTVRCLDSGKGIPLELQSKIFQPFYTTKEVGKGTGLGLSLSNTIVKRHGGEFYIDNESENTCFVIKFPIKQLRVD